MSTAQHSGSNGLSHTGNGDKTTATIEEVDLENGEARKRTGDNDLNVLDWTEEVDMEARLQKTISQTWVVPDGGYGWIVMVCSLMISVIVDGVTYTFGVFLKELELEFKEPKSTITLANSLQVGVYLLSGPVVSVLTNRLGCRPVIIVGSLVAGLSFVASSFSSSISLFIFTYGFMGGVGFGMMYLPAVVAVSIYFDEKRAMATGIAVCGSGVGTFVLAPVTKTLLFEYNWNWTVMILGGIIFNGIVFGALIRPLELKPVGKSKMSVVVLNQDRDSLGNSKASSINSNKNSKSSSIIILNNGKLIPESIPLITLTDDTQTTLLVDPTPKKIPETPPVASLENTLSPATRDVSTFYSSTPNFSSNQTARSSGITQRKKSDSLTDDLGKPKPRNRSNTIDYVNKTALPPAGPKDPKINTKQLSHAPMGLAFIGVSDIHLNRIRDDVALPLSRRDIHRSMAQIEFRQLPGGNELASIDSLHSVVTAEEDRNDRGLWGCLPESARETLEEMLNFDILKEKRFWFVIAGNFFCMLGFYVPFVYIPGKATELGLSDDKAAMLISIIGVTNLVGRVATGVLVNYLPINSLWVTSVALALGGLMTCVCPLCNSYATLIVISAIFGLSVAAYISLCSILLCELLGVQNLTNAFGYVILFRGIACIMGPPIAGALIDASGMFDPAFVVGGLMIIVGALFHFLLLTPCVRTLKSNS